MARWKELVLNEKVLNEDWKSWILGGYQESGHVKFQIPMYSRVMIVSRRLERGCVNSGEKLAAVVNEVAWGVRWIEKQARGRAQRHPKGGEGETNLKGEGSAMGKMGGKPEDQSSLTEL